MRDVFKTIMINGTIYNAEKITYANPGKEIPRRAPQENRLSQHTSLFVKELENTIETISKKLALELLLRNKVEKSYFMLKKGKLEWMKLMNLNFDKLTQQIVGRLD